MSVYEFACRDCRKTFEIVRAIEEYDPDTVECPSCDSTNVERVWSTVAIETSKKS